ncbi:MAG TPA: ATP-binding cassette domain-containing protein [Acidimicrobiales bacterium]|nr:ATP-binding cassette domain-containing protein [Acidimicrobiales bacterium]
MNLTPGLLAVSALGFRFPIPAVVLGALTGITYGLLAVGLVLIYRTSRIINFAHGQMGAFGVAVMGLLATKYHFPYYLALVPALAAGGAAAGVTELVVIRRLRRAPRVMSIVATLGVGAFLSQFAQAFAPGAGNGASFPSPTGMWVVQLGALRINQAYMAMLIFGPVAVTALTVFLRYSRYGLAIRCSSANPEAARMAGISANNMSALAWVIAGTLSALTAVLVIPASGFASSTAFGPSLLLRALAAGVLARMYSLPIAFGSGILIGVVEQLLLYNYPQSADLADVVLYVLILGALLLQRGVRGREEEKGSWAAVSAWRPLPERLSRLPAVRIGRWIMAMAGLALAVLLPVVVSNASAVILSTILAFSIVGISVGVVTGLGGQLSLGQFAVAAAGAVVSFHVSRLAPFPVALLYAGLAGAAVSTVIGIPAMRLKGLLLTVTTLGFALMTSDWGLQQRWALGESILPRHPILFGHGLDTGKSYYYVVLAVFLLALLLAWNTRRLGLGRSLLAVRDNEDNARAFTVQIRHVKLQGFIVAGFIAGLGGAVFGHSLSGVDATAFPVQASIDVVAMTVLGGMSLLIGPLVGAFYIIGLPRFVHLGASGVAASQLGWLILIMYLPGGIGQGLEPLRTRFVKWAAVRHGLNPASEADRSMPEGSGSTLAVVSRPRTVLLPPGAPLLEGRRLSKTFGGLTAVKDVSLSIGKGEIVGLIGPNGAGKTTTFEILSGFTRPNCGQVIFDGTDVSSMGPEQRGRLGLIRSFQDAALFPTLTVTDTVRLAFEPGLPTSFFRSVIGLPGTEPERRRRADELVDLMGLGRYRSRQIQELSTGTRRICELACMVALSPTLLLLDEPSSGVAQAETEALAQLLRRLKDDLDLTMLVIEHDIPMIMHLSDRVIAMETGSVIADGTPEEVQASPLVIEAYLGTNTATINRSRVEPRGGSENGVRPAVTSGKRPAHAKEKV